MPAENKSAGLNMTRAKIMIVDDDPELRMALKLRLRANHYDTVHACDGYSAIALAQREHPNLIILDLGLPAGNGYIVLERLQRSDAFSSIPVIVLTARDRQTNENRSLDAGAVAFFQKPVDNSQLLAAIGASLDAASTHVQKWPV
jgi:two-component system KDP operon response regulator KdpE